MKKYIFIFCALFLALCLAYPLSVIWGGGSYEMMHDISDIESVYIVTNVNCNTDTWKWSYDVIGEVDDVQTFAEELFAIETHQITPPSHMSDKDTVILINYNNGDYALISRSEQIHQYADGTSSSRPYAFDYDSYNALIEKYIDMITQAG